MHFCGSKNFFEKSSRPVKLKCEHLSESPIGPVEAKTTSPTPEVSDWIGLGGTQELECFHKFPDEADAAGLGTTS